MAGNASKSVAARTTKPTSPTRGASGPRVLAPQQEAIQRDKLTHPRGVWKRLVGARPRAEDRLGAAREEGALAGGDLVALEDREAVVEDVARAVVADAGLVGPRLGEELGAPLPLGAALGLARRSHTTGP